jgi:hypothetical protein
VIACSSSTWTSLPRREATQWRRPQNCINARCIFLSRKPFATYTSLPQ